jgi:cation transport ATPase
MKKKMPENLINENIVNKQEETDKSQTIDAKTNDIILTEEVKASIIQNIPSNADDKNKNSKKLKQKNGWVAFGLTLSIIAFVLSMYNFIAKLSFLIIAFYYLVLILIMFFTLFTILQ